MKITDAHLPAAYDKATILAVCALASGTANEGQQKMALDWIITRASNLYDMSYRSDADGGARAEAFHEGRRFVGSQIVKMLRPETLAALNNPKPEPRRRSRKTTNEE